MINTTQVTHSTAFSVIEGTKGVGVATRELFENIIMETPHVIEGFMLRNTYIASENYTGGLNLHHAMSTTSWNNPAGVFRTAIMPKENDTTDFQTISTLGEIQLNGVSQDMITLSIDTYVRTPNKMIYAIDANQNSWLAGDLVGAVTTQMINNLTRRLNWEIYGKIKEGAINQMDNMTGPAGNVIEVADDSKEFFAQIVEAIASRYTMPDDRYTDGFQKQDYVIAMSALSNVKILEEKLVIYDGSFFGNEGKFFQGLPYEHSIGGTPVYITRWMQPAKGKNVVGDLIEAEWIGLPPGRLSPLLFHLAHFSGRAEVVPMTDGGLGIYGTAAYGVKVEDKFSQYITMGVKKGSMTSAGYVGDIEDIYVFGTTAESAVIHVKANKMDVIYRKNKADEADSGDWIKAEIVDDKFTIEGLETKTEYRIDIAGALIGELKPQVASKFGNKELKFLVFPKTV